jgi:hypothetical protein
VLNEPDRAHAEQVILARSTLLDTFAAIRTLREGGMRIGSTATTTSVRC